MQRSYLRFRKKKKGFIGDILTTGIVLFITGIVILTCYLLLSSVNTAFQASDDISATGKTMIGKQTASFTSLWDGIYGFMFIGLSIAIFVSAFLIDTHPIFMIVGIIFLVFFIIVSATMSNAYYEVESQEAFSTFAEDFKIMHYILNNLPYYVAIQGFLVILALYAKARVAA